MLLGPSGSGKTTTLRILAGLEVGERRPRAHGRRRRHHAEPGERDVAMVFQSYALYPHMTVAQNIGFPLKMVGTGARRDRARGRATPRPRSASATCSTRRPASSPAGSSSACALARAIVRQPRLFLLDEPLSNLDAKLRLETRLELHELQRSLGVTTVYVTHDQEEAMTLADRIAVFMDGRIVQVGTPREIFARPRTLAVAGVHRHAADEPAAGDWDGAAVSSAARRCRSRIASAGRGESSSACVPATCARADDGMAATRRARRGPRRQLDREPSTPTSGR